MIAQIFLICLGAIAIIGIAGMMPVKKQRPFFSGTITTVDATLVQTTVDCSILNNQMRLQQGKRQKVLVPKITQIDLEFAGAANIMDTAADRFDLTITPTSQATHPHINDREVIFRHSEYCRLAVGAATGPADVWYLTKSYAIKDGVIVTSQFFVQLTLYATAQVCYYRIYYTWEEMDVNDIAMQIFNQGIINS